MTGVKNYGKILMIQMTLFIQFSILVAEILQTYFEGFFKFILIDFLLIFYKTRVSARLYEILLKKLILRPDFHVSNDNLLDMVV